MGLPAVTAGMLKQGLCAVPRSLFSTTTCKTKTTDFSKNLKEVQRIRESFGLGRGLEEAHRRQAMERFQAMAAQQRQQAAFRRLQRAERDITSLYGSVNTLLQRNHALSKE